MTMAMSKNLKKQWRVQIKQTNGKWKNAGLFETRSVAREDCANWRGLLGRGKTRVVPYVKGQK